MTYHFRLETMRIGACTYGVGARPADAKETWRVHQLTTNLAEVNCLDCQRMLRHLAMRVLERWPTGSS